MAKFTLLGFLGILLAVNPAAAESAITVSVGGKPIVIPVPDGFHRIDGRSQEYDRFLDSIQPPINRLLAMFGSESDLADLLVGKWPLTKRTLNVQVIRELEDFNLSRMDFRQAKDEWRAQFAAEIFSDADVQQMLRDGESALSEWMTEQAGESAGAQVGEIIPLGVFEESDDSLLFALMMPMEFQGGEFAEEQPLLNVGAGALVRVQDRLILLYSNAVYSGHDDLLWARAALKEWRDKVVEANRVAARSRASQSPDLRNTPTPMPKQYDPGRDLLLAFAEYLPFLLVLVVAGTVLGAIGGGIGGRVGIWIGVIIGTYAMALMLHMGDLYATLRNEGLGPEDARSIAIERGAVRAVFSSIIPAIISYLVVKGFGRLFRRNPVPENLGDARDSNA